MKEEAEEKKEEDEGDEEKKEERNEVEEDKYLPERVIYAMSGQLSHNGKFGWEKLLRLCSSAWLIILSRFSKWFGELAFSVIMFPFSKTTQVIFKSYPNPVLNPLKRCSL